MSGSLQPPFSKQDINDSPKSNRDANSQCANTSYRGYLESRSLISRLIGFGGGTGEVGFCFVFESESHVSQDGLKFNITQELS